MRADDPLQQFLPAVQEWFRTTLGEPTPAQRLGWPAIGAGQHTLILAPTGSGKTLAAFLACLDRLWRADPLPHGVQVLYISPLKALNNDIYRNLQLPLEGVSAVAERMGVTLPAIQVAVRTGDTPSAERQRLVNRPPHVLITTPESLHLLLTSRARETLRSVTHCIVDEIHAVCANKRGVFLSVLLERLQALTPAGFTRIGLSATQRPLEEVARYLGGSEVKWELSAEEAQRNGEKKSTQATGQLVPRPVTIVDAGLRKDLDLRVVSPVPQFGPLPEKSVWPSIYRLLGDLIQAHRSTIVFANNRRTVERITAHLNVPEIEDAETEEPMSADRAMWSISPGIVGPVARAHHGSIALEVRQQTEQALKEGRLPAVVATASLELGIDMGAVDLVCQVESPGNVARGLQRVGRAGHVVGQKSKGRLIPKTTGDLLEMAVLTREMAAGHVEAIHVPINCLDVLAQQIVAMVAVEDWEVSALYELVRRAYPYRDLSPQAFETVLEMVSGRFRFQDVQTQVEEGAEEEHSAAGGTKARLARRDHVRNVQRVLASLAPRISWDRVHHRLQALPGSRHLALVNGGTIPDTGQYAAYTSAGVRIGELDEEFIYERRVGDTFALGTNIWRLEQIEADRVLVVPAEGEPALIPFWRGEKAGRSHDLGVAMGRFLAELKERMESADCQEWLESEFFLDRSAAKNLRSYVRRQLLNAGTVPTDRRIIIEACRDPLGDWQVMLLSPLGSRLHLALRLAIEGLLQQRLGYHPQCLHHDDGILIRLADTDQPILDLLEGLTPETVERLVLDQLADSALFALRFRQNAARAMLLPRMQPGKRAPLWLQRLRGRDLLQVARRQPDFPIVAETFRECLHDHLDVDRLKELLAEIRNGNIEVVTRRAEKPSPFAAGLLFAFTAAFMYQYDRTEPESGRGASLDEHLLEQLIAPREHAHLLDPKAIHQVERRLRGVGLPPRSAAEMMEWLRRLGDLATGELEGRMAGFLQELAADGRAVRIELPGVSEGERWILAEEEPEYRRAFGLDGETEEAHQSAEKILSRFLETHALVGLADILKRYPFEPRWAERKLHEWSESGRLVPVQRSEVAPLEWSAPVNLEQVQRGSLALLRREVMACPPVQFADYVLRWQQVHPGTRTGSVDGLREALAVLEGLPLPAELWERTILPARVPGFQSRWLDEVVASGEWTWVCQNEGESGPGLLAFWGREHLAELPMPIQAFDVRADRRADQALECLQRRGASFVSEVAQEIQALPSAVRGALWTLLRRRLVTNDHFDVIRKGEKAHDLPSEEPDRRNGRRPILDRRALHRRRVQGRPEGRWALVRWGHPEPEAHIVFMARVLLQRYGIISRELALVDPWMPAWRALYEVLSRMELAGEVRRGYFVEGLSGAQFALPEAIDVLQEAGLPSTAGSPLVLVHSLDPANLYGSGAPFDIALLDGGTRPLLRRAGNWLMLRGGRPVLIVEQQGKRLTALASASEEEIAQAVALLPATLDMDRSLGVRHKLTVEEWNGQPVTATMGRELLEAAGFVRDYQGMTLYGAWR